MFSWPQRRQYLYGGSALLFLLLIFGAPFLVRQIRAPSCTDGRQNGAETGRDCGGQCALLCRGEASEPRILWQRVFNEGGGVASALLYGENSNKEAGVFSAPYYVKLYDSRGVLVAEKEISGTIPPGGTFAVFAPNLFIGERVPVRAIFETTAPFSWRRDVPASGVLRVQHIQLSLAPVPRVDAELVNTTHETFGVRVVAILYDESGNAVGASQTALALAGSKSAPLAFVWRVPFARPPVRVDIIPSVTERREMP